MNSLLQYLNSKGINPELEVNYGLSRAVLLEKALKKKEGLFAQNGAFIVKTGERTGRSPNDRFIVDEPESRGDIEWGNINRPISEEVYTKLYQKVSSYLQSQELFIDDSYVGVDVQHRLSVRLVSHRAWGALFAQTLFVKDGLKDKLVEPDFLILHAPGLKLDPEKDGVNSNVAVVINFKQKVVLVIGTGYAGEIKKSMFSVMNYYLPLKGIFSMHCSANVGEKNDVALFFGLSGTGKTSLSADPERMLIGDDEHGWSDDGVFNFEGGCYAKVINLSKEKEPQIFNAIRFGSIAENVIMDPITREIDYGDGSITENTRATYPVEFIENSLIPGKAGHPSNILFLTADAFGVMPPIALLDENLAMYHFLSGYTSKLAGTETGITEPQATFSACFGEPFLPLPPIQYAKMLGEKMKKHNVRVWLVNTGWTGGPYGVGKRIDIRLTRAMVKAALCGVIDIKSCTPHPVFKVLVPKHVPGVPDEVLIPKNTWTKPELYDKQAAMLAKLFNENFKRFNDVPPEILQASPIVTE